MKPLLIIALLILCQPAFSQSAIVRETDIDRLFTEYTTETPGVAIAVVQDGQVVFSKGYGTANLEYDVPVSSSTIFHVASVSKQFTAFAIYLLAGQGKLSLEDDIRQYLPELPDFGATIRIRHLLSHTSGLRDQWALLTLAGWRMDDVITTGQILQLMNRQQELNFEPGTRFLYCNTGYTLLACIVEKISGRSFAAFTREQLFEPLGMNSSQFYDDHEKLVKGRADSYEKRDGQYVKKKLNYATVGATSLMTTVEDLARWVDNFDHPKVGNARLIAEFNRISQLENGQPVIWSAQPNDTTYHAKGQLHYYHKGLKVISHGGHDAGFRATLTRFPEQKLSIIALSNDEHYSAFSKLMSIAELYLKDQFQEDPETPAGTPARVEPAVTPAVDLAEYCGTYRSEELAAEYTVKQLQGKLVLEHLRLGTMPLEQQGVDKFAGINSFSVEIVFERESAQVNGFAISNYGAKNVKFHKQATDSSGSIPAVPLIDRQLAAYNSRDLEAFIATYDEQVELYNSPDNLMGKGHDFMRSIYGQLFKNAPGLHCELQNRIVLGNTVIDHEKVSGFGGSSEAVEAIAVYQISGDKISKVYFLGR